MKLPNAECAVAEREKIADYLLNAAHPDNGGKAAFFLALGFGQEEWQTLAAAFRRLAEKFDIHQHGIGPRWEVYSGRSNRDAQREDADGANHMDC